MFSARNFKRRVLCLLLCLVSLLVLAVPAMAAEEAPTAFSSRVHNKPNYWSPIIGHLEEGTKLDVLGETRDFYKIDCYGLSGYILKGQVAQRDDEYYVNCDRDSFDTLTLTYTPMSDVLLLRASILELGSKQLGDPYVAGARGPYSFDCSGLTDYVFKNNGIQLSRAADTQLKDGIIMARENLQVGDLVFFRDFGSPWLATHVGIYAGNDMFLHASSSKGVRFDSLDSGYFGARYIGGRRVIYVNTDGMELPSNAMLGMSPMGRSIQGIRTAG